MSHPTILSRTLLGASVASLVLMGCADLEQGRDGVPADQDSADDDADFRAATGGVVIAKGIRLRNGRGAYITQVGNAVEGRVYDPGSKGGGSVDEYDYDICEEAQTQLLDVYRMRPSTADWSGEYNICVAGSLRHEERYFDEPEQWVARCLRKQSGSTKLEFRWTLLAQLRYSQGEVSLEWGNWGWKSNHVTFAGSGNRSVSNAGVGSGVGLSTFSATDPGQIWSIR